MHHVVLLLPEALIGSTWHLPTLSSPIGWSLPSTLVSERLNPISRGKAESGPGDRVDSGCSLEKALVSWKLQLDLAQFPDLMCHYPRVICAADGFQCIFHAHNFLLLNEFYDIYSCTMIITTQFWHFHPKPPVHLPTPHPISFGSHKFFKVCGSLSVLQSSLCPFF